jgi:hypothetical protein
LPLGQFERGIGHVVDDADFDRLVIARETGRQRTPSRRLKLRPDAPCSNTTGIAVSPD